MASFAFLPGQAETRTLDVILAAELAAAQKELTTDKFDGINRAHPYRIPLIKWLKSNGGRNYNRPLRLKEFIDWWKENLDTPPPRSMFVGMFIKTAMRTRDPHVACFKLRTSTEGTKYTFFASRGEFDRYFA